jgi:hypothetical protein
LTSKDDVDAAKIIGVINEKSKLISAAFAEEIAKMPKEKVLFLSLVLILNKLKPEIIKNVYNIISKDLSLNFYPDIFETMENQFSAKISLEERRAIEGGGFYFGFAHPSYEEAIVISWNKPEIRGFVLEIFNALIREKQPEIRGWCGLILTKNLSVISFRKEAKNLILKVLNDKKAVTRYGVALAIKRFFQNIPADDRINYLKLLLKDKHREIRAASLETVNRNFADIPLEKSLEIISKGLKDRAAYVRLEAVGCVRSNMNALPERLVLKALKINKELCDYSGWFISYMAELTFSGFEQKVNERLKR